MLKEINYDKQKNKHSLAEYILQNGFFLQLDIIVNKNYTWLISAPNINQSTLGIILDGIIWILEIHINLIKHYYYSTEIISKYINCV